MASARSQSTAGIYNVNKPAGMTSHDVVHAVRCASGLKRVGHAGALDPMATGVLIVCVGWATRLSEYLMAGQKRYQAVVHLGIATDTYDAEGKVTAVADASGITAQAVAEALKTFRGQIEQLPPMYAALKRDGRPLHRLARQGKTVELAPRTVHIHELSILGWAPPLVTLDIQCSKGTYIRSLAHDLGEELGCGAHLAALTRLASGPFHIQRAVSLDDLAAAFRAGQAALFSYPLMEALTDFSAVTVDGVVAERIRRGQWVAGPEPGAGSLAMAVLPSGAPVAVIRYDRQAGRWQPIKVLA